MKLPNAFTCNAVYPTSNCRGMKEIITKIVFWFILLFFSFLKKKYYSFKRIFLRMSVTCVGQLSDNVFYCLTPCEWNLHPNCIKFGFISVHQGIWKFMIAFQAVKHLSEWKLVVLYTKRSLRHVTCSHFLIVMHLQYCFVFSKHFEHWDCFQGSQEEKS